MVEYRTEEGRHINKVTPTHYRNYLSAEEIDAKAKENGFSTIFFTLGTGFANWLDDDAYVARQIFYRNRPLKLPNHTNFINEFLYGPNWRIPAKKKVDYHNRGFGGHPILFVQDQNDPKGPLQLLI